MENLKKFYEAVEAEAARRKEPVAAGQKYECEDAKEGYGAERRDMFKGGAWILPRLI
ncbi:MAG: hypothetical protein FWB85_04440 [Chitinispirillia bacterium]|nr:hypothetical protein [Chitinispirillia bacterium]MCL2242780.1 hypothetical protein [Chitinispirillia bacterium]